MRLLEMEPAANSDFLVTIEQSGETVLQEIYFTTFSGVEVNSTRPKFVDGMTNVRRTAQTGSQEVADVTISKPFDPDKDGALIAWIEKNQRSGDHFQMLVRPVRRAEDIEFRGQKAFRLSDCRIMKSMYPGAVDVFGGDSVATVSITASVTQSTFS